MYGGEQKCIQGFVEETLGKELLGRPRRRWGIILRWVFRKWRMRAWTGSIWPRKWAGGGHL